jgi:hypothetical protein
MASREAMELAREILGFSDCCSICGAKRIPSGACSLLDCKDPTHDFREEQRAAELLDRFAAKVRLDEHNRFFGVMDAERIAEL